MTTPASSIEPKPNTVTLPRILAAIAVVLFIILGAIIVPLNVVQRTILHADTYKQAMANEGLYELLPFALAAQIKFGDGEEACEADPTSGACAVERGAPEFLAELEDSTLAGLLAVILPAELLQEVTEDTLDQFFEPLRNPSVENEDIVLNIEPLKENINGPATGEIVVDLILAQPACSLGDLTQLSLSLLFGEGLTEIPGCSPPEQIVREFMPVLQSFIAGLAEQIPSEVVLAHPLSPHIPGSTGDSLQRFVRIGRLGPIVLVLMLGIIAALVIRTWDEFFGWWGIPLLLLGLILLAIAAISLLSVEGMALTILRTIWPAGLTPILLEPLLNVVSAVLASAVVRIAFIGLASSGLGVALLIGLWVRRRSAAVTL